MSDIFVIEHDTFNSQTVVAVGVEDEKLKKWLKKNTNLEINDTFMELITVNGDAKAISHGIFTMIRLPEWTGSNYDIALLAHEAFHLAEFLFNRIGVPYDINTTSEVFAYHIQTTVEKVLNKLGKYT